MSIALIGGMDRLEHHYRAAAEETGMRIRVFTQPEKDLASRLGCVDAVVIFTNKVSHRARNAVLRAARKRNIPVYCYHSCGLCTFRNCLACIQTTELKGDSPHE